MKISDIHQSQPNSRFLGSLVLMLVIAAATAAGAWWYLRGTAVTAVKVKRGVVAEIVYATGSVEPETWSRSAPLVRGRILERCRCEGKRVKTGDVLARLDDREAQATLNDLKALEEFERKDFDRQIRLLERGATTAQAHQKAESDLARIRAQISAQTQRLEYHKLLAPMDGIVLKEDGEVGDMVDPGVILYRIGLETPLWVVAEVNEEDIPRVQSGQKALLRSDAFADQPLTGIVKQVTPAGDPITKTFRVRIGLPADTPLRVGMSIEANIVTDERANAVSIPVNAIFNQTVSVIDGGRIRARKVVIGLRSTGTAEILEGLHDGELVVSPARPDLREGRRTRVEKASRS
jgi:membrane fusion protein (multidrug efflux system)